MFKKLLHGKRKSALLNLTWSGLLCRVVWSVSQLLYLLQRAGHFKFFSPSFFVGLELILSAKTERTDRFFCRDYLRYYYPNEVKPSRMAYFVRPATVRMLSLSMICLRWVSTVLVLTNNFKAISLVDFPSAIIWSTSRSRPLSSTPEPCFPRSDFSRELLITVSAIDGLKYIFPFATAATAVTNSANAESLSK